MFDFLWKGSLALFLWAIFSINLFANAKINDIFSPEYPKNTRLFVYDLVLFGSLVLPVILCNFWQIPLEIGLVLCGICFTSACFFGELRRRENYEETQTDDKI